MLRPRIVLAAPSSGSGKTMITCALLRALKDRGLKVSSFKCGPDYIDPMFHEKVIGTKSGNLDLFFADAQTLRRLFCTASEDTDISVIEGVMGYYDGLSTATDEASTYDVAGTLGAPTVLIIDSRGQSLSALATLRGFLDFRHDSGIRAVIFNRMSEGVFTALKEKVKELGVVPLGFVPKADDTAVESRHLGLVTPDEIKDLSERLGKLASLVEKTVDIGALISIAKSAPEINCPQPPEVKRKYPVRIAAAHDEAFCFDYKYNLALLARMGAETVRFSPIHDKELPEGTGGLLLCGGYPELYAKALSENTSMLSSVRRAIESGMPCLAECGGFMYLHRELEDMEGNFYPMVGAIDAKCWRTKKLGRFGYITLTPEEDTDYLKKGESVRGHEFHYYESGSCGEALTAVKPVSLRSWKCVHSGNGLMAGFPHLFYESAPELAERFLERCELFGEAKE